MYLYRYFDKRTGPFKSLTTVSTAEAEKVIRRIKEEGPNSQYASRHDKYVYHRHNCEAILRWEFSAKDGKEYRKKLYVYEEILEIIQKYGLPQDWNDDGAYGPERYIEVHVWSNKTIDNYIRAWKEGRL